MTTPDLDSIQPLIIEERKVLTLGDDTFSMLSMSERNEALTENYRCLLHFELGAEVERVSVIEDNKLFRSRRSFEVVDFCIEFSPCGVGDRFLATNTLFPFGLLAAELNVHPFSF